MASHALWFKLYRLEHSRGSHMRPWLSIHTDSSIQTESRACLCTKAAAQSAAQCCQETSSTHHQADSHTVKIPPWQVDHKVIVGHGAAEKFDARDRSARGPRNAEADGCEPRHRFREYQHQRHILLSCVEALCTRKACIREQHPPHWPAAANSSTSSTWNSFCMW